MALTAPSWWEDRRGVDPLPPPLMTAAEAAGYLRVSLRQLRRFVAKDLPYVVLGPRCYRYRLEDLERWVEGRVRQYLPEKAEPVKPEDLSPQEQEILEQLRRPRKLSTRALYLKRRAKRPQG